MREAENDIRLFRDKAECCGCTACCAACPVFAINMLPDEEGFEYPEIDREKCIHCRKCLSVCPLKSE